MFDTADTLERLLAALAPAVAALEARPERMRASLTLDLLAVDLADALVEQGVPFRDAHAAVGRLWALAESRGVRPAALPLEQRLAISQHFGDQRLGALSLEAALERRGHAPGGGAASVRAQLERLEARLGTLGALGGDTLLRAPGTSHTGRATPARTASPDARRVAAPAARDAPRCARNRADHGRVRGRGRAAAAAGQRAVSVRAGIPRRRKRRRDRGVRRAACAVGRPRRSALARGAARFPRPRAGRAAGPGGAGRCARTRAAARDRAHARAGVLRALRLHAISRDRLPRKVWSDCVRCPKRHACDEIAVVLDLVPGASQAAEPAAGRGCCRFRNWPALWTRRGTPLPRCPSLVPEEERISMMDSPRHLIDLLGLRSRLDARSVPLRRPAARRARHRARSAPARRTHRRAGVPQAVAAHARLVHASACTSWAATPSI